VHGGGHVVPLDAKSLGAFEAFVRAAAAAGQEGAGTSGSGKRGSSSSSPGSDQRSSSSSASSAAEAEPEWGVSYIGGDPCRCRCRWPTSRNDSCVGPPWSVKRIRHLTIGCPSPNSLTLSLTLDSHAPIRSYYRPFPHARRPSSAYNSDPFGAQPPQGDWLALRKAKQLRVAAKVDELERKEAAAAATTTTPTPIRSSEWTRGEVTAPAPADRGAGTSEVPSPPSPLASPEPAPSNPAPAQPQRPERDVYKGGDARRWFT
jgi:hypothetical protein